MDSLESMSVFVAVAEAGSLSAASRRSTDHGRRKISEVEAYLGTELIRRSNRRIAPTDAGAGYIEACKRILEQIGEAERTASDEYQAPRGELIVTAPIVFGRLHLLPIIYDFLKAYPEIDVRLVQSDRNVNLLDEHIRSCAPYRYAARQQPASDTGRDGQHVVCGSPAYFAAPGMPKAPAEPGAHNCMTSDVLASANAWNFG